jgi:hypothetical protein
MEFQKENDKEISVLFHKPIIGDSVKIGELHVALNNKIRIEFLNDVIFYMALSNLPFSPSIDLYSNILMQEICRCTFNCPKPDKLLKNVPDKKRKYEDTLDVQKLPNEEVIILRNPLFISLLLSNIDGSFFLDSTKIICHNYIHINENFQFRFIKSQ